MEDVIHRHMLIEKEERRGKENCPEGGDLSKVVMPEMGHEEGAQSDGQKNPGKGEGGPDRKLPDVVSEWDAASAAPADR